MTLSFCLASSARHMRAKVVLPSPHGAWATMTMLSETLRIKKRLLKGVVLVNGYCGWVDLHAVFVYLKSGTTAFVPGGAQGATAGTNGFGGGGSRFREPVGLRTE